MVLSLRSFARDEELGKKDDDHQPGRRIKGRFTQGNKKMPTFMRRVVKKVAIGFLSLTAIYCLSKSILAVHQESQSSYDQNIQKDQIAPNLKEHNISDIKYDTAPHAIKITPAHEFNGPVKLIHLASTLNAESWKNREELISKNVLFAGASLESVSKLIPEACEMAKLGRNVVHFALMGRDNSPIEILKSINGIGQDCQIKFHDYSSSSSDTRMKTSVSSAFEEINKSLDLQATLVDASGTEESWFLNGIKVKAFDLKRTIIELPQDTEGNLRWLSLLDSKSLSAWNQVSVEIIIHSQPSATGSLVRLLESLKKADYSCSRLPHLTIELPHNIDESTSHYLHDFKWPSTIDQNQGNLLTLHHRIPQHSLTAEENSIRMLESFWPADPFSSQVLILSPQIEVSPFFFHFLKYLILEYKYGLRDSEQQKNIFGISLDLPSSYLNDTTPFKSPPVNEHQFVPFLWQAPNSNACLFFAEKWAELHDFVARSLTSQHTLPAPLTMSKKEVSKTFPSWLEYFLQLARLRGYMTLYPNLESKYSLVTMHNDLYRVPEEFESDFTFQKYNSIDPIDDSHEKLIFNRKENIPTKKSVLSLLSFHNKLSDLLMLSWEGEELDIEKLKRYASDFTKLFSREIGGCTSDDQKKIIEFSAGDLFCL